MWFVSSGAKFYKDGEMLINNVFYVQLIIDKMIILKSVVYLINEKLNFLNVMAVCSTSMKTQYWNIAKNLTFG